MSRRLARFPQVRVHPGALAAKSDSASLSPPRNPSNTFSDNSSGAARPAGSRQSQSAGATSSNPLWPSVVRRSGTPQIPHGNGGTERARGLSGSSKKSGDDDAHDAANLAELKIAGGGSAPSSRSSSPPTPDSVADLAAAEVNNTGNSSNGNSSSTTTPSSSNGGAQQRVGTATALRRRTAAGSVGRSLVASVPKLKVCVSATATDETFKNPIAPPPTFVELT